MFRKSSIHGQRFGIDVTKEDGSTGLGLDVDVGISEVCVPP